MTELARARGNRRTALSAAAFALAMVGMAYAAVPLYKMFCAATGYGGTTQRAATAADIQPVAGQSVRIRFDANISPGIAWGFKPDVNAVTIKIGERRMAFFKATNYAATATTGRATFNVSPDIAGKYFVKIDCFCFTEQTLQAGQTVDMPVSYYIDPAILNDKAAARIDEITLSYTFFPVDVAAGSGVEAPPQP